jgi:hypothetical protein
MDIFKLINKLIAKRYAINVTLLDKDLTVNILKRGKLKKRFICRNIDSTAFVSNLWRAMQV